MKVAVIGGGAAGYFFSAQLSQSPGIEVTLFEGTSRPLTKVRISGGGRCNVTHNLFDPQALSTSYPRGQRELRSVFARFQPQDTIAWFAKAGVQLRAEPDGRMFPTTNSSGTIIACLKDLVTKGGVVQRNSEACFAIWKEQDLFWLRTRHSDREGPFSAVVLATGSSPQGHRLAESLGHSITPLAPSLFTFEIAPHLWKHQSGLAGVSVPDVNVSVSTPQKKFSRRGPLLLTHWGLSGPAVLKLSAFAARELQATHYKALVGLDFFPERSTEEVLHSLQQQKQTFSRQNAANAPVEPIPKRLWRSLQMAAGIPPEKKMSDLKRTELESWAALLKNWELPLTGKGTFKEEFVTCGGVDLKEIDFRSMQSKICSNLFFAGEVLDVDGITGGFNFQNAWSTAWIAAEHLRKEFLRNNN